MTTNILKKIRTASPANESYDFFTIVNDRITPINDDTGASKNSNKDQLLYILEKIKENITEVITPNKKAKTPHKKDDAAIIYIDVFNDFYDDAGNTEMDLIFVDPRDVNLKTANCAQQK